MKLFELYLVKLLIGLFFITGVYIISKIEDTKGFIFGCICYTIGFALMDVYREIGQHDN